MTWLSRAVEERLAQAAANGEMDPPERLKGKPIPDLDRPRPEGWWADQLVARERSHDRRADAVREAAAARAGFWRCADLEAVRTSVAAANEAIDRANVNLIESDRLDRFDVDDICTRWRELHRPARR
jgi:hypothetical protein